MRMAIIVLPSFNMAATMAFIDPFRATNYLSGRQHFLWDVVSAEGGEVMASNSLAITTSPLASLKGAEIDLAIVSSSWSPERHCTPALRHMLRGWAQGGVTLGALDTGAFLLAEAGLMHQRRATCHYEHIDALAELYPDIDVREDMIVIDERIMTCCGGSAAVDLALHIICQLHGATMANEAAHYLFHQSLRPCDTRQSPDIREPLGSAVPPIVRRAIRLMEGHLEETIRIPDLCTQLGVSQRSLDRLFGDIVGKSPAAYYRDIRLDRARGLVTQTSLSLFEIGIASGFSNQSHFSRAYRLRFGVSPRQDRLEGRIPFEFRAWPMHRHSA